MNAGKIAIGSSLVLLGVTPTPDDITIISPLVQVIAGGFLIVAGIVEKW